MRRRANRRPPEGGPCTATLARTAICSEFPCSALRTRADHEGLEGIFRDLPPEISVVAEFRLRVQDLLEVRIDRGGLGVDLVRRLQAGLHNRLAEWAQLGPGRHQALYRLRIARGISPLHIHVAIAAG